MKKIIIMGGDPNSINSEIIYKSWKKLSKSLKKKIYLISNHDLIQEQFKKLGYKLKLQRTNDINFNHKNNNLKIIDLNLKFKKPFQVSKKNRIKFIATSINEAHRLSLEKNTYGVINLAVNKSLLRKKNIGLTEIFSTKCKIKKNSEVMLIWNNKLSVCPITTHQDLKNVSKKINQNLIINKVKTIDLWFKAKKKKKPKIAILGLNPHNSELRKNSEEIKIILPAIKKLKEKKINVSGPFVADTIFIDEYKKFDVIVGMYHDQVLAPFKSIFKFNAVNVTLGLKYLRISPDHGTAENLIGKNKANIKSFLACLKFIQKFS